MLRTIECNAYCAFSANVMFGNDDAQMGGGIFGRAIPKRQLSKYSITSDITNLCCDDKKAMHPALRQGGVSYLFSKCTKGNVQKLCVAKSPELCVL
jgi:hypothetical protein